MKKVCSSYVLFVIDAISYCNLKFFITEASMESDVKIESLSQPPCTGCCSSPGCPMCKEGPIDSKPSKKQKSLISKFKKSLSKSTASINKKSREVDGQRTTRKSTDWGYQPLDPVARARILEEEEQRLTEVIVSSAMIMISCKYL